MSAAYSEALANLVDRAKRRQQTRTGNGFHFDRARLPVPAKYYESQGLALKGKGAWLDAVCPFHADTKPSLRVKIETGAFSCMACGAHGGDVLAYHIQRHGTTFRAACVALGAWVEGAK